jgi:hypothetical protein
MKIYFWSVVTLILILGSLFPLHAQTSRSDADMQRRHMREYQRYQRHYEEQLEKFREALLEKDENLQFLYSGFVDSERIYLEVSEAYEKLLLKKMALRPDAKIMQDAIAKLQKDLRKPGQNPVYYRQQLTKMRAAQINLGRMRESLKEDEEVKLAFDEMDALEKKYLSDSMKYEDDMAKALAKHPEAKKNQENLDKPFAEFVREKTRQLQPKR